MLSKDTSDKEIKRRSRDTDEDEEREEEEEMERNKKTKSRKVAMLILLFHNYPQVTPLGPCMLYCLVLLYRKGNCPNSIGFSHVKWISKI